jgi:YesN/AraC family two-component response regulator
MRNLILVFCFFMLSGNLFANSDTIAINHFYNLYYSNRDQDPGKALQYLQKGLFVAMGSGNQEKTALFNYHKGYMFRLLGYNNLALTCYMHALTYYEKNNDASLTAWNLLDIGNLYLDEKVDLNMALEHFNKSEKLFNKINNQIGVIVASYCIGRVYEEQTYYTKAIKYFTKAARLSSESKEKVHEAIAYRFLGQTYLLKGEYLKAQEYFNTSLKISQLLKDKQGMANAYSNMAEAYCAMGDTKKGMVNFNVALGLLEEVQNKLELCKTLEKMSLVEKNMGNMNQAIDYASHLLAVADSNYLINQQQKILPVLSSYYETVNQALAFKLLNRYITLKESSVNKNAKQVQLEYEAQLKSQNAILEKEKHNRQKAINYFLAGGLLLAGLLAYSLYSKKEALKETNKFLYEKQIALIRKDEELSEIKKQTRLRPVVREELHDDLYSKLNDLMEREKVFLDNALTLDDLAKQLNTNRSYLSLVINERFNTNFNNYINEYRVKEAQKIFLDPASKILTIEAIAQNVGFNSKSSFNTAFKKFCGLTPRDFMGMQ